MQSRVRGTMPINSNTLWLFVVHLSVLSAARIVGANEFRDDYTYIPEAGGWFKLHRVPLDWQTARMQCYYEGVPLENLFLKWKVYHPNNLNNNQRCIVYNNGETEVCDCSALLPYICFRKLSVTDELTECGTVDKEYKLDARTGHCYKFHRRGESWRRALRVCGAEGAHLAVPDSAAEADVLRDLFAQHPRLLHTPFQNSAAIGFAEWGYHGSWWTIHGKALEDTGYAEWSQGQPDNAPAPAGRSSRQACGAIFRTGKLDDVWCDEPLAFICEKTKHSLQFNEQVL